MNNSNIQNFTIIRSKEGENHKVQDFVAVELPMEIRLSHDSKSFITLSITLCSPTNCEDLVYGYLFTENIITTASDIISCELCSNELGLIAEVILTKKIDFSRFLNKRHGMVHASCGICGKTEIENWLTYDYPKINKTQERIADEIICSLPQALLDSQVLFNKTGSLHACALFDLSGQLLNMREDIGRHNALDKLIGMSLRKDLLPLNNYMLLLSGRVSFELVHKSLKAGVAHLGAIGAPSNLSIEIAQLNQMKLYGFIKFDGFNIYC